MSSDDEQSSPWPAEQANYNEYAIFGTVIFLVFGLGSFVYRLGLEILVRQDGSLFFVSGTDNIIVAAASSAFAVVDAGSGFVIAIGIGAIYYFWITAEDGPVTAAGVAALVGTAVTLVLFFLIALVLDTLLDDGDAVAIVADTLGLIVSIVMAGAIAAGVPFALKQAEDLV